MTLLAARKKSGATPRRRPRAEERAARRWQLPKRRDQNGEQERIERRQRDEKPVARRRAESAAKRTAPAAKTPKAARPPRRPLPWATWAARAMPVLAVALVAALLTGGWLLLDHVGSVPVSRVVFTGKLTHVDRRAMVARVQPLLRGEGFMTVDLDKIRAALSAMPWVATVSVARSWPDELVIAVTEQQPIARWGDDGLLSRSGEVFRPTQLGDVSTLPVLFGPDAMAADVVARYAELSQLLAAQGLKLASLGTDARGSWRADLQGGVSLRLGSGDLLKKMQRFIRVYRADLAARFALVNYVDLRYSNGLAVGWKDQSREGNDNGRKG